MSVAILKIISYWNPIESKGSKVIIKWCHPHVLHCISLPAKTSNCCYVPRGRWYSQPFLGAGKLSFPVRVRPMGAADICSRLFILPLCVEIVMEKHGLCLVKCLEFFLFLKKTISINHCKSGGLMWFSLLSACIAVLGLWGGNLAAACVVMSKNPSDRTIAWHHDISQTVYFFFSVAPLKTWLMGLIPQLFSRYFPKLKIPHQNSRGHCHLTHGAPGVLW